MYQLVNLAHLIFFQCSRISSQIVQASLSESKASVKSQVNGHNLGHRAWTFLLKKPQCCTLSLFSFHQVIFIFCLKLCLMRITMVQRKPSYIFRHTIWQLKNEAWTRHPILNFKSSDIGVTTLCQNEKKTRTIHCSAS